MGVYNVCKNFVKIHKLIKIAEYIGIRCIDDRICLYIYMYVYTEISHSTVVIIIIDAHSNNDPIFFDLMLISFITLQAKL